MHSDRVPRGLRAPLRLAAARRGTPPRAGCSRRWDRRGGRPPRRRRGRRRGGGRARGPGARGRAARPGAHRPRHLERRAAAGTEAKAQGALGQLTPGARTRSVLLLATSSRSPGRGGRGRSCSSPASAAGALGAPQLGPAARRVHPARCEVRPSAARGRPEVVERDRTRFVTVGRGTLRSAVPLGFVPRPPVRGSPRRRGRRRSSSRATARARGAARARLRLPHPRLDRRARHGGDPELGARRAARGIERTGTALRAGTPGLAHRAGPRRWAPRGSGRARRVGGCCSSARGPRRSSRPLRSWSPERCAATLTAERDRLDRLGARAWQRELLGLAEGAWPAVLGCLGGAVLALTVTAARAPPRGARRRGARRPQPPRPGALSGCSSASWPPPRSSPSGAAARRVEAASAMRSRSAPPALVALALARGDVAPGDGDDPAPLLLPPLVCLAAGLVVGAARRARAPWPGARLALPRTAGAAARRARPGAGAGGPARTAAVSRSAGSPASPPPTARRSTAGRATSRVGRAARRDDHAGPPFVPPLTAAPTPAWRELTGGGRGPARPTDLRDGPPRGPPRRAPAARCRGVARRPRGWGEADASAPRRARPRLAPRQPSALAGRSLRRTPGRSPRGRARPGATSI
jgi:hypothetical protein